jgi:hypothetical protein
VVESTSEGEKSAMWTLLAVVVVLLAAFFSGVAIGFSVNSSRRIRWFNEAVDLTAAVEALEKENESLSDSLDLQQFVRESCSSSIPTGRPTS